MREDAHNHLYLWLQGSLAPSSGLWGYCTHMAHTHKHRHTCMGEKGEEKGEESQEFEEFSQGNIATWIILMYGLMKAHLRDSFSLRTLTFWTTGSNKPRTKSWEHVLRLTQNLFQTNSTLLVPSMTIIRWVMLSILFPTLLSGPRIKDSSLSEQKSYLWRRGNHHRTARG